MTRRTFVLLLIFITSTRSFGDDAPNAVTRTFEVKIEFEMKSDGLPGLEQMKGDSRFRYTNQKVGQKVSVVLDEIEVAVTQDEKLAFSSLMNRNRLRYSAPKGKEVNHSFDDAPPNVQMMLKEVFGTELAVFELDANGKELKHTITASQTARRIVDKAMFANLRFFHAPFYQDEPKWDATVEVGAGTGVRASGNLQYEKLKSAKDRVPVRVTGELKLEEQKSPDGKLTITGKHEVSGTQEYDVSLREWVAGEWKTKLTMEGVEGGKSFGKGTGTLVVKMRLVK